MSVTLWRVVEHQASISTRALTDTPEEQERLEELLEATKPPKRSDTPPELHYLLHTPFRYFPCDGLSRFSSARSHGHFYGAEHIETALCEFTFRQWCLLEDIDADLTTFINENDRTAFQVSAASFRAIDLTREPFAAYEEALRARDDYTATQDLADAMQAEDITLARYRSTRDPQGRPCGVLFSTGAFAHHEPIEYGTWHLRLTAEMAEWVRITPAGQRVVLRKSDFMVDGRLSRPRRAVA